VVRVHLTKGISGASKRRSRSPYCDGCKKDIQLARTNIVVEWPGGGIRLVETDLCGACTYALLDLVDSRAMALGVQVSLPET